MIKNKVMFLMSSLVVLNIGVVIGAETVEKVAFTRTICKKMANMYAYSKYSIDKNDLVLFIESNDIASVNELIDVLEQGKKLLNHDIVAIKTENKSALSYWATLLPASFFLFISTGAFLDLAKGDINLFREHLAMDERVYLSLLTASAIAAPVAVYKLYGHYMFTRNKKQEIATLDAIIEHIKLIQQDEVQ